MTSNAKSSKSYSATVYVLDDDVSVRDALANLMRSVGLKVETYKTAEEFFSRRQEGIGCLILDVRLPGIGGLEVQRRLNDAGANLPVVLITAHGDIPMSVRAMKAGAINFLEKPFRDQELLDAVHEAIADSRDIFEEQQHVQALGDLYATLTPREREVMHWVVKGLLNKQIGDELAISESTVKLHRRNLMLKMEAKSLPELVQVAERLKLSSS
jgi:FixJ family two-component response regulator